MKFKIVGRINAGPYDGGGDRRPFRLKRTCLRHEKEGEKSHRIGQGRDFGIPQDVQECVGNGMVTIWPGWSIGKEKKEF